MLFIKKSTRFIKYDLGIMLTERVLINIPLALTCVKIKIRTNKLSDLVQPLQLKLIL